LADGAATTALARVPPLVSDLDRVIVAPPQIDRSLRQDSAKYELRRKAIRRDYLLREAQNSSLGLAGEEFVVAFESARVISKGRSRLSDRVEHISKTKGDGLGFDVLSFEVTGHSKEFAAQFLLYRLFQFRSDPRMFQLGGAVGDNCVLDPCTFMARFRLS